MSGSETMLTNSPQQIRDTQARHAVPLHLLVLLSLILAAFVTALVPINSNDIWWHLKTGDYILATGALPVADPFSYLPATDAADPARPLLILRQYWLAQVTYSLMHGAFGLAGIVWLRGVLCAGMVLAAAAFVWRNTRCYLALLPLLPLILGLRVILEDSDRPHLFIFASALLVVIFLESGARSEQRWPIFLIPPLQVVAAQLHPGFAVSTLVLVVYAVCATWEPRLRPLRQPLLVVASLCVLLFFCNPNGILLVPTLFGNAFGVAAADALEFQSPLNIWRYVVSDPGWLACAGLLLLTLPTLWWLLKRRCWSASIVLFGLALAALLSMRHIGFFIPVAALFAGLELMHPAMGKLPRWGEYLFAAGIVSVALVLAVFPGHANRGKIQQMLQPGYFPVRAADFLDRNDLQGNLFNFISWGGYLEYRLWPRQRVFTDTRILSREAAAAHREIINGTPLGRELMQRYVVNKVILPPLDIYSGEVYPLVQQLNDDPQWSLVHFDDTALVFAKQPHSLPVLARQMVWFQILRQVEAWQPRFPWAPGYQRTRNEAMLRMRGA